MKMTKLNNKRGLTLTELLAVLMILGLLTTIAVPVYVNRQEEARIAVARQEAKKIAEAEETVAALHGFYVPFQILDDLPFVPTGSTNFNRQERINGNPDANIIRLIDPFVRSEDQINGPLQPLLSDGGLTGNPTPTNENARVRNLIQKWNGPYIQFHRFWYNQETNAAGDPIRYAGPADPDYMIHPDLFRDFPLDPWGNPYRFYSASGIIGNGNDHEDFDFNTPNSNFSNGFLTRNDPDRFDRWAVVSYGRDGISDTDSDGPLNNNLPGNDIVYLFGSDGVSRNLGKF